MGLDLHTHSVYSDGSLTPEEIIDNALNLGLSAIAITDHDNVLAYQHAKVQAETRSKEGMPLIEVIPGIEINTIHENQEVHILGYYVNAANKEMQNLISYQQHARLQQITEILDKLNKLAKINIKMEDITALVKEGGSVGRPHIAKAIVNVSGMTSLIDAYRRYICDNSPTYVQRKTISPFEAVEVLYESGAVPVLAHPSDLEKADELVKELMNYGLRGIEAYHRKHSPAMIEYYSHMAERYQLIITGGSDCHGPKLNGQLFLGKTHVPDWVLKELKKEKNRLEIASH